mmetsp:Transcript_17219/g.39671  ORF Transcript_17219/g.39671 Transcript_17219/m.39671 type:complete len:247 (+) Transcript_17219:115-855(+)
MAPSNSAVRRSTRLPTAPCAWVRFSCRSRSAIRLVSMATRTTSARLLAPSPERSSKVLLCCAAFAVLLARPPCRFFTTPPPLELGGRPPVTMSLKTLPPVSCFLVGKAAAAKTGSVSAFSSICFTTMTNMTNSAKPSSVSPSTSMRWKSCSCWSLLRFTSKTLEKVYSKKGVISLMSKLSSPSASISSKTARILSILLEVKKSGISSCACPITLTIFSTISSTCAERRLASSKEITTMPINTVGRT